MKRLLLFVATVCVCCQASPEAAAAATRPEFPGPLPAAPWTVLVDGQPAEVCAFKDYHYCSFDMAGPVKVEATYGGQAASFEVSPRSRAVAFERSGNTISFPMAAWGYYMVRVNGAGRLFIFAERPEEVPAGVDAATLGIDNTGAKNVTRELQKAIDESASKGRPLVLPRGTYLCGQLRLPSNAHLHLCRGAMLSADRSDIKVFASTDEVKTRRFIYAGDAQNVKITGHGIINGNGTALRETYGDEARMRLFLGLRSSGITVEGVMLQDPGSWNTQPILCRDVIFRRVKLMNDPDLGNTDGFDPDGVQNMLIEDCFAYCGDDNVAVKTTGYVKNRPGTVDGVTVRGCVFLTRKSSLKVGTETRGETMRNILFEDNDVIESDRGMALYVSDGTTLENVRYVNNRFERNWPDAKRCGIQFSVNRRNADSPVGVMRGIEVRDCTFYEAFPKESEIKSVDGGSIGCVIGNLVIACKSVSSLPEARIKTRNATVEIR